MKTKTNKCVVLFFIQDMRRCVFCSILGDQVKDSAGRLLYVGLDEWVHINCALWSAEVYEDDSGRLKNVNEALKRGNKLVCNLIFES